MMITWADMMGIVFWMNGTGAYTITINPAGGYCPSAGSRSHFTGSREVCDIHLPFEEAREDHKEKDVLLKINLIR